MLKKSLITEMLLNAKGYKNGKSAAKIISISITKYKKVVI